MIGQSKNREYLSSLPEMPRFVIVLGPKGSGRRTLVCEEYARRGIPFVQIDGKAEPMREAVASAAGDPKAFVVDASDLSANSAGILLKVAEEPPSGAWMCLVAEDRASVLPTLLSRALVIEMAPYSSDEFAEYASTLSEYGVSPSEAEALYPYCPTFGSLFAMAVLPDHGASLIAFADLVVNNVMSVPLANALMISSHLCVGREREAGKHDPSMFMDVMSAKIACLVPDETSVRMARETAKARALLRNKGLNKRMIVDGWVMGLRGIAWN